MPNFKHSGLLKQLNDQQEYEVEIDGIVKIKTGKELKLFILTQRAWIDFKLEQQADLSHTKKEQNGRHL